jgi:FkbM family methyltransferase
VLNSLFDSGWGLRVRSLTRRVGINRFLASVTFLNSSRDYEAGVRTALLASLREGDCVWDVGANQGLYTRLFVELVGRSGAVVAVEPAPQQVALLGAVAEEYPTLKVIAAAASDYVGEASFYLDESSDGTTCSLRTRHSGSDNDPSATIKVPVITLDSLLQRSDVRCPRILKIDVEGFELEVLKGATQLLSNKRVITIVIEVHHAVLEKRGMMLAPQSIRVLLEKNGFKVRNIDRSHIEATRRGSDG